MARLPRLAFADHAHLVLLRGHSDQPVFVDDRDRAELLAAIADSCRQERVALHAYALTAAQVWLLCTPRSAEGLSRAMQALGRRYTASFNRRHGRRGTLWDGRYRASTLEAGATTLDGMVFVDQAAGAASDEPSNRLGQTSATEHVGSAPQTFLTDAAEYWALGNTPFERAAAYRALLGNGQSADRRRLLTASVERGWPVGSKAFLQTLQSRSPTAVVPRPRGRPRKGTQGPHGETRPEAGK